MRKDLPTNAEAERLADEVEATGCRDWYAAAPARFGARCEVRDGATAFFVPSLPVSYMNRVIGLGTHEPADERLLDSFIAQYREARTDFWIHLNPGARPAGLASWLTARGLRVAKRRSWAKFLRGPEPPKPVESQMRVRPAGPREATAFAEIVCSAYGFAPELAPWLIAIVGRPGWEVFLGYADDKPVAAGALFRYQDAAWLGMGATLAEYRGRGGQSALLAARIAAARDCRVLVTETGEPIGDEPNPSLHNIARAGFVQICSRLNYTSVA